MPIFVVHKHNARRLHYDLRLEYNRTLKSWAVPKQPPLKPGIKRLAVQVENHQLSYAKFHGVIPKGKYGAGKVSIWDRGTFKSIKESKNSYVVSFKGRKLKGKYCLFRFKNNKQWLLFKQKV